MKVTAAAVGLVLASASASAYAGVKVYVNAQSEDSVGGRLVYELREQIRKSASMDLSYSEAGAGYVMHIVTIKSGSVEGFSTAYSFVLSTEAAGAGNYILSHWVGTCGSDRIRECAGDIVADADKIQTDAAAFWARVVAPVLAPTPSQVKR